MLSHCLIEVTAVKGCVYTDLNAQKYIVRVCRPIYLNNKKENSYKSYKEKIGSKYDLRNIFDLIRYVYPNPPVPKKFRRNLIGLGAGDPTRAICSSLIAEGFKNIDHPILPLRGKKNSIALRHRTFCLPKDFDISPFFQIIKPSPQKFH